MLQNPLPTLEIPSVNHHNKQAKGNCSLWMAKACFYPLIFLADYHKQNFSGNRNGYQIGSKNGFYDGTYPSNSVMI